MSKVNNGKKMNELVESLLINKINVKSEKKGFDKKFVISK